MSKVCEICGQGYNDTGAVGVRCPHCGEIADFSVANIPQDVKSIYSLIRNAAAYYNGGNYQSAVATLQGNQAAMQYPYAQFLYGMSMWMNDVKRLSDAAPYIINSVQYARSFDSANSLANLISSIMTERAADIWERSVDNRVQALRNYYEYRDNYEAEKINGNLISKGLAKSAEATAKKTLNEIVSSWTEMAVEPLKIAFQVTGDTELYKMAASILNQATKGDAKLKGKASDLFSFFENVSRSSNSQSEIFQMSPKKINPASPVEIKKYSIFNRTVDSAKKITVDFTAPQGIRKVTFKAITTDDKGAMLYAQDVNCIYLFAENIVSGNNSVTFGVPTAKRLAKIELVESEIEYLNGNLISLENATLIDRPTLKPLSGVVLQATERLIGSGVKYQWEDLGEYWNCPCGKTNIIANDTCLLCGRKLSEMKVKASSESIELEVERIRRENAHKKLEEYKYAGVVLLDGEDQYFYDLETCVFKKNETVINQSIAVHMINIDSNRIGFINAEDGAFYTMDKVSFEQKRILDQNATYVTCINGTVFITYNGRLHCLNATTMTEEKVIKENVVKVFYDGETMYYLLSNGELNRLNEKGKGDTIVKGTETALVVSSKIVFNDAKKGLLHATVNGEKQKVGFLKKSYVTGEKCVQMAPAKYVCNIGTMIYFADTTGVVAMDNNTGATERVLSEAVVAMIQTESSLYCVTSDGKILKKIV